MSFSLDQEPLETAAARAAEIYVKIYRGLEPRRVFPDLSGVDPVSLFEGTLTDSGIGLLDTLREFDDQVLPTSMATAHPRYMGLINCSPLPAAPLADLLVSSLNNNAGAAGQGPAAAAAEREIIRSFSRLFYGDEKTTGMILPGGTYATLQGLMLARTRRFPEWNDAGPGALRGRPVVYTSDVTHFSVSRSAVALGVGRSNVVAIATTGRGSIDPAALAKRIDEDRAADAVPLAVVATVGTTGTGAVDPVAEIARLCRERDIWLHVDACYGGGAILCDELKFRFDGVNEADSVALDPHKWFFCPLTTSLLLVRDPEIETAAFDIQASYIPHREASDAFRRGMPTSRRASSLTLWMMLRAHGWNTVRDAVRRNIAMARLLERELAAAGFRVLPDGELSTACARWEPEGWSAESIDRLQDNLAADAIQSGQAWFATVRHRDQSWMRFNIVNIYTAEDHVRDVVRLVQETAGRLTRASTASTQR